MRELLRMVGWAVWSLEQGYRAERGGTRQTAGLPDIVAIGDGHVLFIELKVGRRKLSNAQKLFGAECLANGGEWVVWRDVSEAWIWLVEHEILREGD